MENNTFYQTTGGVRPGSARTKVSHPDVSVDPNDLIDSIMDAIDYAEMASDAQGLIRARRLLNNDLRQAIDVYVQNEVTRALHEPEARRKQLR